MKFFFCFLTCEAIDSRHSINRSIVIGALLAPIGGGIGNWLVYGCQQIAKSISINALTRNDFISSKTKENNFSIKYKMTSDRNQKMERFYRLLRTIAILYDNN